MGEHKTGRSAREREQQALGEDLAQQPAARASESAANCNLLATRRRACEQQAGDVAAADEQHKSDAAEQHPELRAEVPDENVVEAFDDDAAIFHSVGLAPANVFRDRLDVAPRPLERDARLQRRHDAEEVRTIIRALLGCDGERRPEAGVELGQSQCSRCHSDNGVLLAAEGDLLADDRGIAAELRLPQRVAQHDDA